MIDRMNEDRAARGLDVDGHYGGTAISTSKPMYAAEPPRRASTTGFTVPSDWMKDLDTKRSAFIEERLIKAADAERKAAHVELSREKAKATEALMLKEAQEELKHQQELAAKAVKKLRMEAMNETVQLISGRWMQLCSREVQLNGARWALDVTSRLEMCVENIIHASNFDREKFTYQQQYQSHVEKLLREWNKDKQFEVIAWIESEEARIANHHKRTAEYIASISDPVDVLPDDLMDELSDIAIRAQNRAVTGVW